MNRKTLRHLANLEERIMATENIYLIEHLINFPFPNITAIRTAEANKSLSIIADYSTETLNTFSTSAERKAHNFWLYLPYLCIIFIIIYSIYASNYYLLFGIPLCLGGVFTSSPYFKGRSLIYFISFGLFIWFIYKANPTGYILTLSYLFSLWASITARDICISVLKKRALESPILFTYMFRNKIILLYDKNKDSFIRPN